jgi:hypothetical protein
MSRLDELMSNYRAVASDPQVKELENQIKKEYLERTEKLEQEVDELQQQVVELRAWAANKNKGC